MTLQDAPRARVLLVANDVQLERSLTGAGFTVSVADSAAAAEAAIKSLAPDIVIVDVEMERQGPRPLHLRLRESTDNYLLCIEHNDSGHTRIELLHSGADDAVSAPVAAEEIVARCHAMLRRPRLVRPQEETVTSTGISVGPLTIDTGRREIRFAEKDVHTTNIEFQLLAQLCRQPALVISRPDLIKAVWGPEWVGGTHVLDVHLSNLRRKLRDVCDSMPVIHTVQGVGFKLSDEMLDAAGLRVELAVAS